MSIASRKENIDCFCWNTSQKTIDCDKIPNKYNLIIIDGYCENWEEMINSHSTARIIMAMRIRSFRDLSGDIKQRFKIASKTGMVDDQNRVKGILQIKKYA